jgi:hypothetical protein
MRLVALALMMTVSGLVVAQTPATVPSKHDPSELVGTWRGTSTCSDRVAAPACHDEVVIYDFSVGEKPGTVVWKADKLVNGERQTMGELDVAYDPGKVCWVAEFSSPRTHMVWCLVVDGAHVTGTGQQLPGKQTVRKIDARKD